MNILDKIFNFLASLKLAVITILALAISLAAATFAESLYGTPFAQHYYYKAPWFTFLLIVLATNILFSALSRWPWKPRHYGFVVTHAGILILLFGSFVTQRLGTEGSLVLDTHEKSSEFTLHQNVVSVYSAKTNLTADFPADNFKYDRPSEQKPVHFVVPNGGPQIAVTNFYDNSVRTTRYTPGSESDPPAVHFQIANARVKVDQWLGGDSDEHSTTAMGLATFKLATAINADNLKDLLGPQHGSTYSGQLVLTFPKTTATFDVDGNLGKYLDIPNTAYKLKMVRYLPDAELSPDKKRLINKSEKPVNPTLEFDIVTHSGVEEHTVLAVMPNEAGLHGGTDQHLDVKPVFKFDPDKAAADNLGDRLLFVSSPDGKLYVNQHSKDGSNTHSEFTKAAPYDTGWMGLQVTLLDYLPHAAAVEDVVEAEAPKMGEGPPPALHLVVANGGQTKDLSIRLGEGYAVMLGGDNLEINYRQKTKPMGFALTLDKFKVDRDPGTTNAAAYTSNVTLDDPARGQVNAAELITMNEPLHHNGWTFFQSSFSEVNGEPRISIFTVAYDPGVPIKYAGSIIMCLGIAMMFWLRGWYQNLGKTTRRVTRPSADLQTPGQAVVTTGKKGPVPGLGGRPTAT